MENEILYFRDRTTERWYLYSRYVDYATARDY